MSHHQKAELHVSDMLSYMNIGMEQQYEKTFQGLN